MRFIRPAMLFVAVGFAFFPLTEARAASPPAAPRSFVDVLRQTAAVVEGDVEDVTFRYDNQEGPRTVAKLVNLVVHLGSLGSSVPQTVELRSFGGPLPDGREVSAQHVPALAMGQRYVVFLRNTEWTLSPVAYGVVLRVERRGFSEALVDPFGRLVVGVGLSGPLPGAPFWARREGGLESLGGARSVLIAADEDVKEALDPREFRDHLRAFAAAMDAWPNGSFSMVPSTRQDGWSFVPTTSALASDEIGKTNETPSSDQDDVPACFDPSAEGTDPTVSGGETCDEAGVP